MPQVNIISKKSAINKQGVEPGDLILISDTPFMVVASRYDRNSNTYCKLVNLTYGQLWSEEEFVEGISENELVSYIDNSGSDEVHLIKSDDYKMSLEIEKQTKL